MNRKKTVTKKGFTLIELLVVIAIIGILSSLLLANYNASRARARDAQRKSDLRQTTTALELYKNSQSPPTYPATASWENDLETGGFMKTVPHDPLCPGGTCAGTWSDYYYAQDPGGSGDNLTYKLVACLENASDPQKDSILDADNCSGKPASFTRTEP